MEPAERGDSIESLARPVEFELRKVRLRGVTGLRSAHETISDREVLILCAFDEEGNRGWSECSALRAPGYSPEYLDGAWALLEDVVLPAVIEDPDRSLAWLARFPGNPMARAAAVGAIVDLGLRHQGISLTDALGDERAPRTAVPSTAVVGICDTPAEVETAVGAALDAGHRSIKLKIDPPRALGTVRVVRSSWPMIPLAIDANGSFPDAHGAIEALGELESVAGPFDYVEQPLGADDLVGAAIVARSISSPIALDESITSIGEATTALSLGALRVLNLKPARVGGPIVAMSIARLMASRGCDVFCGGMVESGIGRAAALAIAAQPECTMPTDLGPSERYHLEDVTAPFELVDGLLEVPSGPGIGVEPVLGRLADQSIRTTRIRLDGT